VSLSTRSPYRVQVDPQVSCRCGKQGQALLTAGASYLPAFYLCAGCGNVGQVGVSPVEGRVDVPDHATTIAALRQRLEAATALPSVEHCLRERANGNGGCGACALCCKEATDARDAAQAHLARVRAAVIECAYCNGVGRLLVLPGDKTEPCPACGALHAALDGGT